MNANVQDAVALSTAIKSAAEGLVTSVNISYNRITDTGIEAFAHVLRASKAIKEVDISFNDFTEKGATSVAEALQVQCCCFITCYYF